MQIRSDWSGTNIRVDGVRLGTTGSDGSFVLLGVPPGSHVLEASHLGFLSSARRITAVESGPTLAGEALLMAGDTFQDGRVDALDASIVLVAVGRCQGSPAFQPFLDLDGSGCVNAADLDVVFANFGRVGPVPWSPVPPPSAP